MNRNSFWGPPNDVPDPYTTNARPGFSLAPLLMQDAAAIFFRLRNKNKLSQAQMAELLETKQSAISRIENARSMPSAALLEKLADKLDERIMLVCRSLISYDE